MTATTAVEKEVVLDLFKNPKTDFNASSIAKELNRTRVGTFKALKELEKDGIVKGKRMGKAIFYKINLKDDYAKKNVETLLMEEARKKQRWLDEFKELFEFAEIVIMFGSITKNEEKAGDIDLLIVLKEENNKKIDQVIKSKNELLLKKIHPVKQTKKDLIENIKKKDKVILNALKGGIVLHGFEKLIRVIESVSG